MNKIDNNALSLSEIINILVEGKKIIIGVVLSFVVCAFLYITFFILFLLDPVYTVSSKIRFDNNKESVIYLLLGADYGLAEVDLDNKVSEIKRLYYNDQAVKDMFVGFFDKKEVAVNEFDSFSVKVVDRLTGVVELSVNALSPELGFKIISGINNYIIVSHQNYIRTLSDLIASKKEFLVNVEYSNMLNNQINELIQQSVYVVDDPVIHNDSDNPRVLMIIMSAIIFGGITGVIIVIVLESLRKTVRTTEELERKSKLNVFSVITESTVENRAESLRVLRSKLLYRISTVKNNRVMISSLSQENKEEERVVGQIASLFSEAGKRVLLIDANLRKGTLFKLYNTSSDYGLAEYLVKPIVSPIHSINNNFDIISGEYRPDNPSELLLSDSFSLFLEELCNRYDIVLINVPPANYVIDAIIVGMHCDTNLIFVESEKTHIKDIEIVKSRFDKGGVDLTGCLLDSKYDFV